MSLIICNCANFYFYFSRIPIHFWSDIQRWKQWEIDCFEALNGDRFHAVSTAPNQICFDKLSGDNLWNHTLSQRLTLAMIEAAALEFQRAHQMWSYEFDDFWSHGDAGFGNVIYDEKTGRARFIDFELAHTKTLSSTRRHADDLLVFLQDLITTLPEKEWLDFALCFLKTYANEEVIKELKTQLIVPTYHLSRLWWHHRTSFSKVPKIKARYQVLKQAIESYLNNTEVLSF